MTEIKDIRLLHGIEQGTKLIDGVSQSGSCLLMAHGVHGSKIWELSRQSLLAKSPPFWLKRGGNTPLERWWSMSDVESLASRLPNVVMHRDEY